MDVSSMRACTPVCLTCCVQRLGHSLAQHDVVCTWSLGHLLLCWLPRVQQVRILPVAKVLECVTRYERGLNDLHLPDHHQHPNLAGNMLQLLQGDADVYMLMLGYWLDAAVAKSNICC
jgi:hypothetical protein